MCWKVRVEPVKWTAARSRWVSATGPISLPSPWTTLTTPSGRPASRSSCIDRCATRDADSAGFQTTVLPRIAGANARLFMQVKLNGVTARTKPSSGRYSTEFHAPGWEPGWTSYMWSMFATFARMKSIVSQAASMSAWYVVFDSSSMVAALSRSRHGPYSSRSAARRNGATRSSHGSRPHQREASDAAVIAAVTCSAPAWCTWPSRTACACGVTTGAVRPVRTSSPPTRFGTSYAARRTSASAAAVAARSGEPAA
jgi:hypothetical protein